MSALTLTIDGHEVSVAPGQTVLDASRQIGLEIPTLCFLEKCGPLTSCQVCLVKINGKLVPSCATPAQPGMVVESETDEVHEARRTALELLFSDHVGDCLAPCHRLCPLGLEIPAMLRQVRTGQMEAASATVRDALPLPSVLGRLCHHPCEQGCRRGAWDNPAGIRELERFVADQAWASAAPEAPASSAAAAFDPVQPEPKPGGASSASPQYLGRAELGSPEKKPATGKSVVIIGAGPAGLAAAHYLLRRGHTCTIADRHEAAGGSLRTQVEAKALPREILDAEIRQIERLGAQFKPGASLGPDLTLDGLMRGCDAVLIATGEISKADGEAMGLEMAPGGIKTDPGTCQTARPGVFAAGRAVKPVHQLVRAMAEGQAAAICIHQFLRGQPVRRPDRPFSSLMGRLEKEELKTFVHAAGSLPDAKPCDVCAGLTAGQAAAEASRCLHCDCRSSGQCALQHYAQVYGADPGRFRQARRLFEQQGRIGGLIFEPGKCIRCGICVKLSELAGEPFGLAFIGRGFDMRVGPPLNRSFDEALSKSAEECAKDCPTGALVLRPTSSPDPG
jgi:NADPH-dependent glutamate synthase beta subunit-like oxidoreductase/ferredoxin